MPLWILIQLFCYSQIAILKQVNYGRGVSIGTYAIISSVALFADYRKRHFSNCIFVDCTSKKRSFFSTLRVHFLIRNVNFSVFSIWDPSYLNLSDVIVILSKSRTILLNRLCFELRIPWINERLFIQCTHMRWDYDDSHYSVGL